VDAENQSWTNMAFFTLIVVIGAFVTAALAMGVLCGR
jgi:hypothetical protein